MRHFRLDRIKRVNVTEETFEPRPEVDPAAEVDGWLRTGEVETSRAARVLVSPERARWAREARRVVEERGDGSVVVELSFAGTDWLVREILKEAGDAAVLEPQDAREAVRAAVAKLREAHAVPAERVGAERRLAAHVSRREQIKMSDAEVAAFLAEERTVTCATIGPRGWPHLMPLWYVLREAPAGTTPADPADLGVDVRRLRRRCATSSATRARPCRSRPAEAYQELRGVMLECEVVIHRELELVAALGAEILLRNSVPRGEPAAAGAAARGARRGRRPGRQARRARVRRAPPRELGSPQARRASTERDRRPTGSQAPAARWSRSRD